MPAPGASPPEHLGTARIRCEDIPPGTALADVLDRAPTPRAHFRAFGDSSLDFEVVYFVLRRTTT